MFLVQIKHMGLKWPLQWRCLNWSESTLDEPQDPFVYIVALWIACSSMAVKWMESMLLHRGPRISIPCWMGSADGCFSFNTPMTSGDDGNIPFRLYSSRNFSAALTFPCSISFEKIWVMSSGDLLFAEASILWIIFTSLRRSPTIGIVSWHDL